MQPGEKEQWKLQVSGSEKQSVEMLAALYDASLDELAPAQNWQQQTQSINQDYRTSYYTWNTYNFVNELLSTKLFYDSKNFDLLARNYEKLNLLDFNYYGGYNSNYREIINAAALRKQMEALNQQNYLESVAAFKNGFDVKGRVVDAADKSSLDAVTIAIKGTKITTLTNEDGSFKLRVPENAVLVLNYIGYTTQEFKVKKGESPLIRLKASGNALSEVVVVGYGTQARRSLSSSSQVISESNEPVSFAAVESIDRNGNVIANGKLLNKVLIRGISSLQGKVAGLEVAGVNQNVILQNPIITRKNFNETAFFYPQLKT
ncbi:MAG: hypothetical protein EOP42_34045, partial [Sphingobacteriaceae bacterium]